MYPVGGEGGCTQPNCSKPNPSEDTVYLVGEGGGGTQSNCSKPNPLRTQCTL